MKKKWLLFGGLALVLVFVAVVVGVGIWFESPGVRVMGGDLHAEISQTGYIFDGDTGEFLGQTPVTVDGSSGRADSTEFDGDLLVLGYQNSAGGTITATKAIEKTDSGFYLIRHLESCTHSEQDENGITKPVEHFCDYYYTYYLYPEKEDFLVVVVENFEEGAPAYVVCADSREQAEETYAWFLENRPAG